MASLKDEGLQPRIQGLGGACQRGRQRLGRVTDVRKCHVPLSLWKVQLETSIEVGGRYEVAGLDIGPHKRVTGETVPNRAGDLAILGVSTQGTQHDGQEQREEGLHESGFGWVSS